MPVFKYEKTIRVGNNDDVVLTVRFPDAGTTAVHNIDIPGPNDIDKVNEFTQPLGKGAGLKVERTIVFTKAANLDANVANVRVEYLVNGKLEQSHSNTKDEDPSPQIKLKLTFQ
jgi:hypothetical protein